MLALLIRSSILSLLLLCIAGCCSLADCREGFDLEFRLVRDGKNALFGPDAFIHHDSISYRRATSTGDGNFIYFNETNQTVFLFTFLETDYVLDIEGIREDTISITTEILSDKGCCPAIQLSIIRRNGIVICNQNCTEIVEIEI